MSEWGRLQDSLHDHFDEQGVTGVDVDKLIEHLVNVRDFFPGLLGAGRSSDPEPAPESVGAQGAAPLDFVEWVADKTTDPEIFAEATRILSEGAAPRAEGLDRKTLSMALHSLLPMDPGHWTVWQPNDFGGGKDVPANSAEFADAILARLSRPSDERVPEKRGTPGGKG